MASLSGRLRRGGRHDRPRRRNPDLARGPGLSLALRDDVAQRAAQVAQLRVAQVLESLGVASAPVARLNSP